MFKAAKIAIARPPKSSENPRGLFGRQRGNGRKRVVAGFAKRSSCSIQMVKFPPTRVSLCSRYTRVSRETANGLNAKIPVQTNGLTGVW